MSNRVLALAIHILMEKRHLSVLCVMLVSSTNRGGNRTVTTSSEAAKQFLILYSFFPGVWEMVFGSFSWGDRPPGLYFSHCALFLVFPGCPTNTVFAFQ